MYAPGIEPATPRFPTYRIRLLDHADKRQDVFKTITLPWN